MADLQPISIQQLVRASANAIALDAFVNEDASTMVFRPAADPIETLDYWRDYMSNLVSGKDGESIVFDDLTQAQKDEIRGADGLDGSYTLKGYETEAEMIADAANLPANVSVNVTNDTDTTKNGMYVYDGTTFTKSPYDPLTQAKSYTDTAKQSAIDIAGLDATTKANAAKAQAVGEANTYTNQEVTAVYEDYQGIHSTSDTKYIPLLSDSKNNILIGYDTALDKAVLTGVDLYPDSKNNYVYFTEQPLALEVNHIIGYGQSLSLGATATTIISTSQPYLNTTFNTGPRQDAIATSVIPLVEQYNNPSAGGGTTEGETHCSGAANYASLAMLKENGINPASHVIFASTAGRGGANIDQLKKGSSQYAVLLDHVTKAKNLNSGKTYHVPVLTWAQGENNTTTAYATYKAALQQLQVDVSNDIKVITGQIEPVRFITYQMSYYASNATSQVDKVQLDLVRENENFMLATPTYHLPFSGDGVHLTNVGYKWMGAYFGRAYKQYMTEGRKSDFINPKLAYIVGNKIFIKFDVPKKPLVLDVNTLAPATDFGFKLLDGVNQVAISSIIADGDTVTIQLVSTPTKDLKVRYAKDYRGAGLIVNGASGNLRDSTTDSVDILGIKRPLYHVCPHFELTAYLDKGI